MNVNFSKSARGAPLIVLLIVRLPSSVVDSFSSRMITVSVPEIKPTVASIGVVAVTLPSNPIVNSITDCCSS